MATPAERDNPRIRWGTEVDASWVAETAARRATQSGERGNGFTTMEKAAGEFQGIAERLDRIEAALALLVDQRVVRDWYTTSDVADILGKAEFTVREWCRLGRLHAEKRESGRGNSQEWAIPHAEVERYRRHGLRPLAKHG